MWLTRRTSVRIVIVMEDSLDWSHRLVILERSLAMCRPEQMAMRAADAERLIREVRELRDRLNRLRDGLRQLLEGVLADPSLPQPPDLAN